ncbi:SHOCT domain-containing protein [Solirubrobacter soli]|uniref:SHOCT domain-containing protein n=1 Tax=Solirubrobacter soli TaxID=363832 RepID=UPI00041BCF37|nr:SHOCT domain-containing protein [Solirubrobacter soli]
MLGKKGRFEKKLARGEAGRAPATILRVTKLLPGTAPTTVAVGTYRAHVRVEPTDEPSFEASVTMHVTSASFTPRVGEQIPVIYHESSVAWDTDSAHEERGRLAGARLDLKPDERDRFRATLLARLDEQRAKGKIDDAEYLARRAEIEADPELRSVSGS